MVAKMDPFMQALMQILQSSSMPSGGGGMGPSGEFSQSPGQDVAQQMQVGQSLQLPNELSPTGMNPGFQQNAQMFQNKSPVPGMQQPLQPGHTNAINSGQGHSSMMSPPTPQSIAQYLNQPQGIA